MTLKRVLLSLLIAGMISSAAAGQTVDGRISGTVTDPNSAIVPGVEIEVLNEETGVRRQVVTGEAGNYVVPLLQPGRYRLTATLPGFRTYQRTGILVGTSESITVDLKLEIGEVRDMITVTGTPPLLEASTSDVGQLIEPRTVSDMPLNGRRALNLAQLSGATVWVNYSGNAKPNFSLAGGRSQSQNFSIDGGTGQNMRLGVGQIDTDPPVEAVREFKILSNSYSAEYGGSAGGLVIMTTKSGTNEFHGSVYEYFRNDVLDAAGFFAPVDPKTGEKDKAPLRYNLFGGTLGGPIFKNKMHFFGGYEGTRQSVGMTEVLTVPTELQRQGDFSQTFNTSGALIRLYDPATTRTVSGRTIRDPFEGNKIPSNRLDPVGVKLLSFWPLPNRAASSVAGANNFSANSTEIFNRDNVTARIDHVFNQKSGLYGRYMYNKDPITRTSVLPDPRADAQGIQDRFQHNILLASNYAFRPNLINDLRFSFSTRQNHAKSAGLEGKWDQDLGLKGISGEAFPRITVTGIAALGSTNHERRQFPIRQYHAGESMTWIRGTHIIKMGAESRKSTNFEVNRPSISGVFGFGVQPTSLPGTGGTGFALASLLLGIPNTFNVRETEVLDRYSWYLAGFVQDDWKIHPDLTLNLGMRWEVDTPMTDRNERMNGFDPVAINPVSGTPGVVRFAGIDGWPDKISEPDWNNFGPRLGFAWRPFGSKKTVVRGGGGFFYAHPFDHGAPASAALGFEKSANLQTPDNGITAPFVLRDGVPPVQLAGAELTPAFGAVAVGRATTTAVTFYERDRRTGYSQQFNIGVQHELRGVLLEALYLGNLSRKLANVGISINQVTPDKISPTSTQRDRPFPQFSNVTIQFPAFGITNYHAGSFKAERRFSGGLSFLGTYTLSKNLGNADSGGNELGDAQFYQNFYNRRLDYGPSGLDLKHRLTWSSVWELPFGRGRRWLSDHSARYLLGGWTLGAIGVLQSGPAFSVNMQTPSVQFLAGPQKPDLLRDPNLATSKRVPERWFDTEAFAPPTGAFGNAGNGVVRADGDINFDFSLIKNFLLTEDKYMQFRMEAFNAFNHPNFGLPGHVLGGPGFGIVTSANSARIIQLGLRAVF